MNAPDDVLQMLDEAEVERVLKIVEEATIAPRMPIPETGLEQKLDAISARVRKHGVLWFATMVVMALIAAYTKSRPLSDATLALGIVVHLFGLALLGITALGGILPVWHINRSLFVPFFRPVGTSAHMDMPFVHRLTRCQKSAIQYVLTYYKYERAGLEKRSALPAGAVERIGLLPATAALVLLVTSLTKESEITTWTVMFGPLIFAFHVMNIAAFAMGQKMDRAIAMLEFCVQSRK